MCPHCESLGHIIPVPTPDVYCGLVDTMKKLVADGVFDVSGECGLDDIQQGKVWPGDHIRHVFTCRHCGQRFTLEVETYHGTGGRFEPEA